MADFVKHELRTPFDFDASDMPSLRAEWWPRGDGSFSLSSVESERVLVGCADGITRVAWLSVETYHNSHFIDHRCGWYTLGLDRWEYTDDVELTGDRAPIWWMRCGSLSEMLTSP